jgi:Hydrazine synthase alpha subunit middle domain
LLFTISSKQRPAIILRCGADRRAIAPAFYASSDPTVSFDAAHILFAGKSTAASRWQIWEAAAADGNARQITHCPSDCTNPLYLPDGRIVYTRASASGSDLETASPSGGSVQRLTFAPGHHVTQDVLRDGRILFQSDGELYAIYPDGTGVESLRCDHGPARSGARQIASGDVIFSVGRKLARFTPALATQVEIAQPDWDAAGLVAEVSTGEWVVSIRKSNGPYGLYLWRQADGSLAPIETPAGANAVQPVLVRRRAPPRQFPSALVPTRATGNLLCLNARDARDPIAGAVAAIRMYTRDAAGKSVLLGRQKLAGDGSFYVEVPADQPLRIELLNAAGQSVRAEHGWFWMRPSEQRICVGCHMGPERSPENKVAEILLRTIVPEKMLGASR